MSDHQLHHRSLGSQIADHVRQDILLGRLRAGQAISQDALCAEYGTSRMPVRDALRTLASEGLLVVNANSRRAIVAQLTADDFDDIFVIEALVHARAARRATRRASEADVDALQALHEQMLHASGAGDRERVADINWRFHATINRLADSPKLLAVLRAVSLSIPRDYLAAMPPDAVERSNGEHLRILQAMRRRSDVEVDYLVRMHVEEAGRHLVGYLAAQGLVSQEVARRGDEAESGSNAVA